jgi:hypothetical protein
MLDIDGFLTSPEFVSQIAIIIAGLLSAIVNGLLESLLFGSA